MDKRKNIHALYIGIFLVIAIFMITYIRFYSSGLQRENPDDKLQDEISTVLENATRLSPAQLAQKINNQETLNLIDVRDAIDYAQEHLPDSINIPLPELRESIKVLEKNKPYILIDNSPSLTTTAYAVKTFSEAGFSHILYLEGGFSAWKKTFNQTISSGDPTRFNDQSKVSYITSDKLKELLGKEKNIVLIDVRKNSQYQEGHLKNARNIFLGDIESKKKDFPVGGKIVLYDDNGLGSFQAAVRLFDLGIFNALTLSDGLDDWKSKNYEIVK